MKIQGLIYDRQQNTLQDAGDLDGQIIQDLRSARNHLHRYQRDHLDAKIKGVSGHYDEWTAATQKKIAWLDRLIQMAERAGADQPMMPADSYSRSQWDSLRPEQQERAAIAVARRETARIGRYLEGTVHVERQSAHPEDWYLWTAAARRDAPGHTWDCWTLNMSTCSMNGGRYGLSYKSLVAAMLEKKGIETCQPEKCRYFLAAQDTGSETEEDA